jgi:hypothetical protein
MALVKSVPYLFSIFLNDLEEYFIENNIDGLEKISSICQESLLIYIKLFLIVYADDTVLMSETPEGSQKTLTAFENYYNNWKLKLNTSQTKVVVFSKRRIRSNFNFNMYGQPIEVQDSYSYLGVTLNYNGNFNSARKKLLDQTQKSLYGLL